MSRTTTFTQTDWDSFYHLARKLCLTSDLESGAAEQLFKHLVGCRHTGGDYMSLLHFSKFYGIQYILPKVIELVVKEGWARSNTVVDLGAGFGWLGTGLSKYLNIPGVMEYDKRPWSPQTIFWDAEEAESSIVNYDFCAPTDALVVSSDFLHCLNERSIKRIVARFFAFNQIHIYYSGGAVPCMESYLAQTVKYGSTDITPEKLFSLIREVAPHATRFALNGAYVAVVIRAKVDRVQEPVPALNLQAVPA